MLIFSRIPQQSIINATHKAQSIKPKIRTIEFAKKYEVTGSSSNKYTVTFGWNIQKEFTVDCTCAAGKNGLICFHSAAVAPCYKLQVRNL